MGVSTNAILVFGWSFGEEGIFPGDDGDPEEFLNALICHEAGIGERPEGLWEPDNAVDRYLDKRSEAIERFPVEIVYHCSSDYPMFILAVRGTERCAHRGHPLEIRLTDLTIPQVKIDALKAFAEAHHLKVSGEPRWFLCSMWS